MPPYSHPWSLIGVLIVSLGSVSSSPSWVADDPASPTAVLSGVWTAPPERMAAETLSFKPGEVIIKYKAHLVRVSPVTAAREGRSLVEATGHPTLGSLDSIHRRYGLRLAEARPLFNGPGATGSLVSDGLRARERFGAVKGRFPDRQAAADARFVDLSAVYRVPCTVGDEEAAAEALRRDPHVEYAEVNHRLRVAQLPDDTYVDPDQDGTWSSGTWGQNYDDLWGAERIEAHVAWAAAITGTGVLIGLVDTGVDYRHEDIAANVWVNVAEAEGTPGVDDDGNGYVDDIHGYDFAYSDPDPMDGYGHGTHVAGTLAAPANGIGIVGVAPGATILAVKGLDDWGWGYESDLALAVQYAADNGARVLNNSWGGRVSSSLLEDAFHYAYGLGCVAVAAAGNAVSDVADFTPANIDTVMAVSAVDPFDAIAWFSNYGTKLDVSAPGVDVLSLRVPGTDLYGDGLNFVPPGDPEARYYRAHGTSMACPHTAGLATLLLSARPHLRNDGVRQLIRQYADDLGAPGFDNRHGYGRINAARAVLFLTDCNTNGIDDAQDIAAGTARDCNGDAIPDECLSLENDCNGNTLPDECDTAAGTSRDCNTNGVPDECEPDCNTNGFPDECDLDPRDPDGDGQVSSDCNVNGIPDECLGPERDCNTNGIPDACDLAGGTSVDDDENGFPDECQRTRVVPSALYPTIQSAIDASGDGDIVLVEDGVYTGLGNRDLDFGGRNIILHSRNGAEFTILDIGWGRGFNFHSGEPPTARIEGLTIRNGRDFLGGGVYCEFSGPTIVNCIITGNIALAGYNGYYGGGIYSVGGDPIIKNCVISGNTAQGNGGGVFLGLGTPALIDCTIAGNTASTEGGGVFCTFSRPRISGCVISGNTAGSGGGIACAYSTTAQIDHSTITGNRASQGAGVSCSVISDARLSSCLITHNSAFSPNGLDGQGGGLYCFASNPVISNCTFTANGAFRSGGGIFCYEASPRVRNSILWGDLGPGPELFLYGSSHPLVAFSNVEGGLPYGTIDGGGNIDADPRFVDPATPDYLLAPASQCINTGDAQFVPAPGDTDLDGDPRVLLGRVDMGADEATAFADCNRNQTPDGQEVVTGHATDCDRNGVLDACDLAAGTGVDCNANAVPDACEAQTDCNSNGVQDICDTAAGTSPDCNNDGVPDECNIDCNGNGVPDECELASGAGTDCNSNSIPDDCDITGDTATDCNANGTPDECEPDCNADGIADACDLTAGTSLDSDGDGTPDECPDPLYVPSPEYPTIQAAVDAAQPLGTIIVADGVYSGTGNRDLDFRGKAITLRSVNGPATCIIDCQGAGRGFGFHSGEPSTARVEGFTVRNGAHRFRGGGILCVNDSSPSIRNCIITDCSAGQAGGGVFCGEGSRATLTYCRIAHNAADETGGGVHCGIGSRPTLVSCTIEGNTVRPNDGAGGGVFCEEGSSPILNQCTISANRSGWAGGGVYCSEGSGTTFMQCLISGNAAESSGGGVFCYYSLVTMRACLITGNVPGGIGTYDGSVLLEDGTITENAGAGVECHYSDNVTLRRCILAGNLLAGIECRSASPTIENCAITENQGSGIYLVFASPRITACTIAGNSGAAGGILCASGNPTLDNCLIRNNTAAYLGGGLYCAAGSPVLSRCRILENTSLGAGGGVACYSSSSTPVLRNCTLAYNQGLRGGGLSCEGPGRATVNTCTLVGNTAEEEGGGVYGASGAVLEVANSLVWNNAAAAGAQLHVVSASAAVSYSDIGGGWPGVGNVDADPLFVDVVAGDLHLTADSPCRDAGDPNVVLEEGETDIDLEARLFNAQVDMGSDEFHDCNDNTTADCAETITGTRPDCNANRIPDECEPQEDCNGNGVQDVCDIAAGTSEDCAADGNPDECELVGQDCNTNSFPDECDILAWGISADCNENGLPDECEVAGGTSSDCNRNVVPDECESDRDCNNNGHADICELAAGTSADCNVNGVPDECDLVNGTSADLNSDGLPDECQTDCNANSAPDDYDLLAGASPDCNTNAAPDACDLVATYGGFSAPAAQAVAGRPSGLAVGDFDGDGHLDLAVTQADADRVSVLRNNGDGTFFAAAVYPVGDHPEVIAAHDLNGTGHLDVLVVNSYSDNVAVLRNQGEGTFAAPAYYPAGDTPRALAVVDLDGDDDLDVAVANLWSADLTILLNHGDGTFAEENPWEVVAFPAGLAVADWNGDGLADVAVAHRWSDRLSILSNKGADAGGRWLGFAESVEYAVADDPVALLARDLDGDGAPDLAAANEGSSDVAVLLNEGDGDFAEAVYYSVDYGLRSLTAGDFDGDGDTDLAATSIWLGTVTILLNEGAGTFAAAASYPAGVTPESVVSGDWTGDGTLDLAVPNGPADRVSILQNQTVAPFSRDCNTNGLPDECEPDFDGDGWTDACDPDADGDGVPDPADVCVPTPLGAAVNPSGGPKGDFDDDCDVDLVDYAAFEPCLASSGPARASSSTNCQGVADFDADGDVDLVDFAGFQRDFVGLPTGTRLVQSTPADQETLWRSVGNIIRLRFDGDITLPGPGHVLIQRMLSWGDFGPDLAAHFAFQVENDDQGRPRILRLREQTPCLTPRSWVAVRQAGGWPGVAAFSVEYMVQVGDVTNDGRVVGDDAAAVYHAIPTPHAPDDSRPDVNGDGRVLATDASAVYGHMPSFAVPKPSGH